MLRHCIVAGSTVVGACLFASAVTAGSAMAQTTGTNAGRPLQLLQNIKPVKAAAQTKTTSTPVQKTRTAAKNHFRPHTRVATRRHHAATQTAQAAPEDASPTALPAPIAEAVPMPSPALEPVAPSGLPSPSELVVGGQEVRVASPNDVNEIDLAANNAASTNASTTEAAATAAPAGNPVETTPKADTVSVAVARQEPDSQERTPVGSTSWIMQVLAALGGAVAAGSVAWFLIGSAPQRTYG